MKAFDSLYQELLRKYGCSSLEPCSEDENQKFSEALANNSPLPADIIKSETQPGLFLRKVSLPDYAEAKEAFYLGALKDIKTIKSCVLFFTVLAVISLVGSLILLVQVLSALS